MKKTIFVLLIGNKERGEINDYQRLQEDVALGEGRRVGFDVEVVFAGGFDQLLVLRKRLRDAAAPVVDAVVTEPATLSSMDLILKELKAKTGLVLLNSWGPSIEEYARAWGGGHPFGTVSTDHRKVGEIQGRQVSALLPRGGNVLCVTGPQRSAAAQQRLEGMKATLGAALRLSETEAAQWTEADGIMAFNSWYGVFKARNDAIEVVAAQNDALSVGARNAAKALANISHREMFGRAKFLGVDGCPSYGRRLVDSGQLAATVVTTANTGVAIAHLQRYWRDGAAVPVRTLTEAVPYPASSV
jgi:ABC-type sugar transport system substrate-binding protein